VRGGKTRRQGRQGDKGDKGDKGDRETGRQGDRERFNNCQLLSCPEIGLQKK